MVRKQHFHLRTAIVAAAIALPTLAGATEYHVAVTGRDSNPGTRTAPFRSIGRAATLAMPGDTITVHKGIYREWVNPPRGGLSDSKRITYRAAPGEKVEIRGSEVIRGWTHVRDDVWRVAIPAKLFGKFNPFGDVIKGDWFDPRGRVHHTGAVYLNGEWLAEAASEDDLIADEAHLPAWLAQTSGQYLLNVAWLTPGGQPAAKTPGTAYTSRQGTQNAACSEGGDCVGWIEDGNWLVYEDVDCGKGTEEITIRAASETSGGTIEIHRDTAEGELLGSVSVPNTGGWQTWASFKAKVKPLQGPTTLCLVFRGSAGAPARPRLWYAVADTEVTTIAAQFGKADPNKETVEVNVRRAVFYPDKPGRNYITVRGFAMRHAATPWAPPTAEQVGLIGTHWSKGWIIEDNTISHSTCSGISLGKHGDRYDNTSANTAEGYVKTIERGLARGWDRRTIGSHIVRRNNISFCEQAGIVGSLGAAFSTVTDNTIHDIHMRRYFSGAEMAGIKFHGAIDTVIAHNHIYRTCLGLWLDWMAQGTRVSRNLFHDNGRDLFVEVDHGPFVVDCNLFLSAASLLDVSEGGAYAHNLFCGNMVSSPEPGRETPYHPAHSTVMAGLSTVKGGDDRFYNNVFIGAGAPPEGTPDNDPQWSNAYGTRIYNDREYPLFARGNLYLNGARPYKDEKARVEHTINPHVKLTSEGGKWHLNMDALPAIGMDTLPVNSVLLGRARVPDVPYTNPDGSQLSIEIDYLGKAWIATRPLPGPFRDAMTPAGVRVW